jgi:ketosteroid isomerase-like protein
MSDMLSQGGALYAALASGDEPALRNLLSPDFQGRLSAGLPRGLGRSYHGLEAMMAEAWGAVGEMFDVAPKVERLFDGGDTLIGLGAYVGTARSSGRPLNAGFAHFWGFDGRRFTSVVQVTDSHAWHAALEPR